MVRHGTIELLIKAINPETCVDEQEKDQSQKELRGREYDQLTGVC